MIHYILIAWIDLNIVIKARCRFFVSTMFELADLPVYALSDNAAIKIIDDKTPEIIGSDYIVAEKGEIK